MPVTLTDIGIQSVAETTVQSFTIEKKVEPKVIVDSQGRFAAGGTQDPTFEVSLSGTGDLPDAIIAGTDGDLGIAAISTGVTIVSKTKETQKHDGYNAWEASASNFPGAS